MNKIIRRLAVVAVAALLCSGPGLAQGAMTAVTALDANFNGAVDISSLTVASDLKTATGTAMDGGTALFDVIFTGEGLKVFEDSSVWCLGGSTDAITVTFDPGSASPAARPYGFGVNITPAYFTPPVISATFFNTGVDVMQSVSPADPAFLGAYDVANADVLSQVDLAVPSGAVSVDVPYLYKICGVYVRGFDPQNPGTGPGPGDVPEPTTLAIWSLLSLIGLAVVRRRRRV